MYVWNMCLGNPDSEVLFLGNEDTENSSIKFDTISGNSVFLLFHYFVASAFLLIVLLNMLIAIMSDEFTKQNEVKDKIKFQEKLRYVLDKWVYKDLILNEKGIKYVVAIF